MTLHNQFFTLAEDNDQFFPLVEAFEILRNQKVYEADLKFAEYLGIFTQQSCQDFRLIMILIRQLQSMDFFQTQRCEIVVGFFEGCGDGADLLFEVV